MKKIFLILLLTVMVVAVACKPKDHKAVPVSDDYVVPEVADVVMYQVIDSIEDLGVNMIWIMPIYPIGQEKSKNSPYSVRDYKAVAPEYGTVDDLKMLVESCHERGMGVILDWVANHTAWDNVWVKEHPDWYTHDSLGNIIYPPGTDWTDVADLDYNNKDMRAAMIDAMRFWVDSVGIDGFRCDVADQVPVDFWSECIDNLRAAAKPRRLIMLAEGANPDNFKAGFDLNYAWEFMHAIAQVMKGDAKVGQLVKVDQNEYKDLDPGKFKLRFTTNHDESTKATPVQLYGGVRASMAAFVATTMLHGGMLVYGSQEVLRSSGKVIPYDDDENNVLCVDRVLNNDNVLVIVNVRDKYCGIDVPGLWSDRDVTNLMTGVQTHLGKRITLEPYQYLLLYNNK